MTQYDLSSGNYSETDSANNNPGAAGWAIGQAPSNVGAAGRAFMGSVKRAYDWDHGGTWAAVTGTANAIVITYPVAPLAYVQGQKHVFKATAANAGATTVNINSLGAKNIYKRTPAGVAALSGGEIQASDLVEIEYDGTQFQIMSEMSAQVGIANYQAFSSTGNFTVPAGIYRIFGRCWGAGGGGGYGSSTGAAAGGGGGGYAEGWFSTTPGTVIAITIGAAGAAGFAGTNGTTGGTTSIGAFMSATGGAGGVNANVGQSSGSVSGGAGSGGQVNFTGGASFQGQNISSNYVGGNGGMGATGGSGGAGGPNAGGAGNPGLLPGGGGGGGSNASNGGAGANGLVILQW